MQNTKVIRLSQKRLKVTQNPNNRFTQDNRFSKDEKSVVNYSLRQNKAKQNKRSPPSP